MEVPSWAEGVRRFVVCLVLSLLLVGGLLAWWASASQAETASSSPFGSESAPLVVPAVQPLDESEQLQDASTAARASAAAVAVREASHFRYVELDAQQARAVARRAFPRLIEVPDGGPPQLPSGEHIVGYPADTAAAVVESVSGKRQVRSVIESTAPMALETSPGHRVPINLRLSASHGGFRPGLAPVPLSIPNHLARGVRLDRAGVSLTPVAASGKPLGGSGGTIEGTTVFYANTLPSGDSVVKPLTAGFSIETLLRSISSPRTINFRVGLPAGAALRSAADGEGAQVLDQGRVLATIPTPGAEDAEGTPVPVSMTVAGATLAVEIHGDLSSYRLPVAVDPTVEERWAVGTVQQTAWYFAHSEPAPYFTAPATLPSSGAWTETVSEKHSANEWGGLAMTAPGASQIVTSEVEGHWDDERAHIQNYMNLWTSEGLEDYSVLPVKTEGATGDACLPANGCPGTTAGTASPKNGNTAIYQQESTGNGEGRTVFNTVTKASVQISQEAPPTAEFNKGSRTIHNKNTGENFSNVLYGAGSWLGPRHGALETITKDPGLGIDQYGLIGDGFADTGGFQCIGVVCSGSVIQSFFYNRTMKDGEGSLELSVRDPVGLNAQTYQTIKVDSTPPHGISVQGLVNGNELSSGETNLILEATDGEGSIKSSGIKSIKLRVDGKEVATGPASCSPGPCSASSEATLAARDYSSGSHILIVTATDNAENVAQEEFTFRVHGVTPVTVGPGAIDPSTGELTLSASDAPLDANAGVSRTYQSRHLTAGAEGPLGPQWSMRLGGSESLSISPQGSAVLSATGIGSAVFTRNTKGEFVAPAGDANLKLNAEDGSEGHIYYLLSDSTAGTSTKFMQPSGSRNLAPRLEEELGGEAKLNSPAADAVDRSGNLWVASNRSSLIEKFSPSGTLLGTYGSEGTRGGEYKGPWGIASDPSSGNVYVSDVGNDRVEELNSQGGFVRTFGWGVKDNKPEFEVCESSECDGGIAGSGPGQFSSPRGVTVGLGYVFVADCTNNRVEVFSLSGAYRGYMGSSGNGNGQFSCPTGVTVANAKVEVADYGNNRIETFSNSGEFLGILGPEVKSPMGITSEATGGEQPSGNFYVAQAGTTNRVEELSSSGAILSTFGAKGSGEGELAEGGPLGIAVSSSGVIYVTNTGANVIDEWTRPTWLPTEAGGPASGSVATYAYATVEAEGKTSIEPSEVLAPVPAGVGSCEPLARGCRALTFNYAHTKTASGESESQWGDYAGRLTRIYFHAWDPAKAEMTTTEVAHYLYDAQGRLRAEWDPRIEQSTDCGRTCGPLKTFYGYDAEGHVTSIRSSGQEPWAFTYGTIPGDPNPGRLLKVTRSKASTALHATGAPSNTEVPKISGTPVAGNTLGVSTGKWSEEPIVYGYQWEDCNAEGKACTPITGATNANYKVSESDTGHTLEATVTASSGGGTTAAAAGHTAIAHVAGELVQNVEEGSMTAISCIPSSTTCATGGNAGPFQYATTVSATELSSWHAWNTETSQEEVSAIDCVTSALCLSAQGSNKLLSYATSLGGLWYRVQNPPVMQVSAIACPSTTLCVAAQNEQGKYAYSTNPASTEWTLARQNSSARNTAVACPSTSVCVMADNKGTVRLASSTTQIEGTTWTETNVDGTTPLAGLACSSVTSCIAIDTVGNVLALTIDVSGGVTAIRQNIAGTTKLTGAACAGTSCYVTDAGGNIYASNNGGETWAKKYSVGHGLTGVSCASSALCAAVDSAGDVITLGSTSSTEGERYGPQPGTTIEYNVGVSGSGAPHNLSEAEAAKWGQTDAPVEAAAIFPADEPQGWPATDYKRATISYWDAHGRMVNAATPSGAIATTEYNPNGDVVRSLSADNREAALKEGSKSAEVSKLLDTESRYSGETEAELAHEQEEATQGKRAAPEPGTELLETRGPQHKVKLAEGGAEVIAREHVRYSYDEGSPEGHHYGLLTKTIDGAEYEGKEGDLRTSTRSYAGQGWKLGAATSTTTDAGGLNVTTRTVYDENTGSPVESSTPGSSSANPVPAYSLEFGSKGTGEGQLETPWGAAVNPKSGNVYVASYGGRVEEFTPTGKFIAWVGTIGAGEGQMSKPEAITVDASGNIWVGDGGNDRIDVFNEKGEFVRQFGSKGTGNGHFKKAIDGITVGATSVWASDTSNNRIEKFSLTGTYEASVGKEGSGNGQFSGPSGLALAGESLYVDDSGNHRVQQFTIGGEYKGQFGSAGKGNGQLEDPVGIAADPKTGDLYVSDYSNTRVEQYTGAGTFVATVGSYGAGAGQLTTPEAIATSAAGTVYIVDQATNRVEVWAAGYTGARTSKTIYYTTAANSTYPACGEHPEWATLPCLTKPNAQPENSPALPESTYSYNVWDEVTKTEEAFGSITRTKNETYDPAGRAVTSNTASSVDAPLGTVSNEYNPETGALIKQSSEVAGSIKSLTSKLNNTGQLIEYTDAEGNIAKYTYEEGGDERLLELSESKGEELHTTQTYGYDAVTGLRTKLTDSASPGLTFTAKFDVEGKISSQNYPGGLESKYTYNEAGEGTGLEYVKAHGSEHSTWFSEHVTPSIHGEALLQASTLATEHYTYDTVGRLTQTQEEPAGKPCVTRLYAYDEESNRTSLINREGTEGKCATEGGSPEIHVYDSANRLLDSGLSYDAFGNTTKLPGRDTGAGGEMVSSYYVDNQLESQTQNGETLTYVYDPSGRTLTTHHSKTNTTSADHYAGPGGSIAWTSEGNGTWTRNIAGLESSISATQTSSGTVTLQLRDLNGDTVATAGTSESETKLQTTYNSTEFGVPQHGTTPPKYAWQGASGLTTESALGSGGVANPGGASYVPLIGRPLQTQQIAAPGAFPDGGATVDIIQATYLAADATILKGMALEHEAALREAAQKQAEAAAAATCNEEVEGCGPDPAHGANPWGCGIWASWGHGLHLNNYLAVHGHWLCVVAPAHIEVQIALLEVVGNHYKLVDTAKYSYRYPGDGAEATGGDFSKGWICEANHWYQAWVWGRTWDEFNKNQTTWYATAEDGHWDQCPEGVEDPTEGPDQFVNK